MRNETHAISIKYMYLGYRLFELTKNCGLSNEFQEKKNPGYNSNNYILLLCGCYVYWVQYIRYCTVRGRVISYVLLSFARDIIQL